MVGDGSLAESPRTSIASSTNESNPFVGGGNCKLSTGLSLSEGLKVMGEIVGMAGIHWRTLIFHFSHSQVNASKEYLYFY